MMLLLLDEGVEFEAVFSDTGCEWPETYEYLHFLEEEGYEFTWLQPEVSGTKTLYDLMEKHNSLPSWGRRFCTSRWKQRPIDRYVISQARNTSPAPSLEKPCTVYMGYDAGERQRHLKDRKGIHFEFPLRERGIGRNGCKKIIQDHGLPVPRRSGCWLCPFQRLTGWIRLKVKYPDLFQKAVALEDMNPNDFTFREGMRLSSILQNTDMDDYLEVGK